MKRFLFSAFWILGLTSLTLAQWTNDPWNGMVTATNQSGDDVGPQIVWLSSGYSLVTWCHENDIRTRYQVLNQVGVPLLGTTGNYIIAGNWQFGGYGEFLVPDGEGGAIIVFTDQRDGSQDIYGQRFDSLGNRLWGDTGLPLVLWTNPQDVLPSDVAADDLGNFFVAWDLDVTYYDADTYLQKFDRDGNRIWGDYGVPVAALTGNQYWPQIVPDGQGGVLDVWQDCRSGSDYFYLQHFDENGGPWFAVNGIQILDMTGQPMASILMEGVTDGGGGGIWCNVGVGGPNNCLYLFRLNGQGRTQWVWSNYSYCQHGFDHLLYHPVDGSIWLDVTENPGGVWSSNLYRFDHDGNPLFTNNGVPYGGDSMAPTLDGVMTAKVEEIQQGTHFQGQRVDSTGTRLWTNTIALGGLFQGALIYGPNSADTDGSNGMVIAFEDYRQITITGYNISAQRVLSNGQLGNPTPNPHRPDLPSAHLDVSGDLLTYALPQTGQVRLELYDLLGRRVATLLEGYQPAGAFTTSLNIAGLPSGLYFLHLFTSSEQQTAKVVIIR